MPYTEANYENAVIQLIEQLGLDIQPNILSRKLNHYRQALMKEGISFSVSRTGKQRFLSLRLNGNDDMTIKARGALESAPSPQSLENTGEML